MSSPLSSAHTASSDVARGAILAIDYGRRRFGLAVSDPLGMIARPLAVWTRTNRRRDLARLRELCRQHAAARIVVGWPLCLGGAAGEMAAEAARFAEQVRKHLCLPVELEDERLSSWQAEQLLDEPAAGCAGRTGSASRTGSRPSRRRAGKPTDDVAAAVILRDYLSRKRGQE